MDKTRDKQESDIVERKTYPAEVYTAEEVTRILKAISLRAPSGIRNRAIVIIGYRAGLRLSEVLSLHLKDLDLEECSINVLRGKGRKQRIVGLDPGACAIVQRWVDLWQKLGFKGSDPLFCTITQGAGNRQTGQLIPGQPLKTAYIRGLMKRLGKKAGIDKRVHFHGLRHSFAADMVKEGITIPEIAGSLGHSSIATTSRYLDHIAPQDRIDRAKKRVWDSEGL
ncbi:Tyrosine recombinase XerC [subsurface metagenome]